MLSGHVLLDAFQELYDGEADLLVWVEEADGEREEAAFVFWEDAKEL